MRTTAGLMLFLLVLACASSLPAQPATADVDAQAAEPEVLEDTREQPDAEAPPATDEALADALERSSEEGWRQLDLVVECQREGRLESVEVWGSGVGVWQGGRQFRLPREEVAAILDELRRGRFAAMSPVYGGPPDFLELSSDGTQGARIICRIVLELDGQVKQVVQRKRGEQSAELKSLADGILDRCRERGLAGVGADSLADGLAKLAAGTLAPEVLSLVVQRRPEGKAAAGETEAGWLMGIDGRQASARTHRRSEGYGQPVMVRLEETELRAIATFLSEMRVESLPINLWAEEYTDLLVEVLDHRKRIQARRFAGMEPGTHGEAQGRFDRVFERLDALGAKVLGAAADPSG